MPRVRWSLSTLNHRSAELGAQLVELIQVRSDDQGLLIRVLRQNRLDHSNFGVHRRADPVAFFGFGGGVHHPLAVGHRDPDFHALSWRDPALRLNVLPRRVIALWSDKENTSPSRPSSRINVAVSPSRRLDCRSAVIRKTGAGNRCTSS